MKSVNKLLHAAAFAAEKHRKQPRKGADPSPYINHPLEVAQIIALVGGVEDEDILVAAILHDTVEDTETTLEELSHEFGPKVSGYVNEVSDNKSLPKAERKRLQIEHAAHLSVGAKIIRLGDKITNVREIGTNPPADWSLSRQAEYLEWAGKLVDGLRDANPKLEEFFDQTVGSVRKILDSKAELAGLRLVGAR